MAEQPTEAERVAELHQQAAADYAKARSEETRIAVVMQRAEAISHAQQATYSR